MKSELLGKIDDLRAFAADNVPDDDVPPPAPADELAPIRERLDDLESRVTALEGVPSPEPDPEPVPEPPEPEPDPEPDPLPPVDSPTGRNPKLLWTPQLQSTWQRMRDEQHPWMVELFLKADTVYWPVNGSYEVLAYQITGNADYAQKAWTKIKPIIGNPDPNTNHVMERLAEYTLWYDWLLPALSEQQQAEYRAGLKRWCDWCVGIGTAQNIGGFRLGDSDRTVGQYLGLALHDAYFGSTYLDETSRQVHLVPVGGLAATAVDRTTVRNCLRQYAEMARGGCWIESSNYNILTSQFLWTSLDALRSIHGVDHFPEYTSLRAEMAKHVVCALTPDLKDSFQWGDEEHPRTLRLFYRHMKLAALGCNETSRALHARYPPGFPNDPWWMYFYHVDHPTVDANPPVRHHADGMGISLVKTPTNLFGVQYCRRIEVHHEVPWFGAYQLYANGEWVVTHPLGYIFRAESANGMLLAGLGTMYERGPVRQEHGDGWHAFTGATTGSRYQPHPIFWNPPPPFVDSWTRTVVFLEPQTLVIRDVVKGMRDPRTLTKLERYFAEDRQSIEEAAALKQWLFHVPFEPQIDGAVVSWQTAGGQDVRLYRVLPREAQVVMHSNHDLRGFGEKWGHRLHVMSDSEEFLHVVTVGGDVPVTRVDDGVTVGNRVVWFGDEVTVE